MSNTMYANIFDRPLRPSLQATGFCLLSVAHALWLNGTRYWKNELVGLNTS